MNNSHRVISISMNEQDWQAFIRIHPQPVLWLREKIRESLTSGQSIAVGAQPTAGPLSAAGAANTTSATTR